MSEDQDIAFNEGKAEGRDEAEREMRDEIERLYAENVRFNNELFNLSYNREELREEVGRLRGEVYRLRNAAKYVLRRIEIAENRAMDEDGGVQPTISAMVERDIANIYKNLSDALNGEVTDTDVGASCHDHAQTTRSCCQRARAKERKACRQIVAKYRSALVQRTSHYKTMRERAELDFAIPVVAGIEGEIRALGDGDASGDEQATAPSFDHCLNLLRLCRTELKIVSDFKGDVTGAIWERIDEITRTLGDRPPWTSNNDAGGEQADGERVRSDTDTASGSGGDEADTDRPTWAVVPSNPDATWFEIQRDGVTVARNIRDGRHAVALMRQLRCGGLVDTDVADFPEGKAEGSE